MRAEERPSVHTVAHARGRERTAARAGAVRVALSALALLGALMLPELHALLPVVAGYLALTLLFQWLILRRILRTVVRAVVMGVIDLLFATLLTHRMGSANSVLPLIYVAVPVLYATTTSRRRLANTLAAMAVGFYVLVIALELSGVLPYAPAVPGTPRPDASIMLLSAALVALAVFVTAGLTTQLIAALGRANTRLRDLSQHDELTGLYNRRYLFQRLDQELARVRRSPGPLTVVMVDLDGFKRVNDEIGHDAGDGVLCAVAGALLRATRKADVVARHGGDEFIVLLPQTDVAGARQLATRMLDQARAAAFGVCPSIPVSASVGMTEVRPDDEPLDIMRRVDERLYTAKRAGGDRIAE